MGVLDVRGDGGIAKDSCALHGGDSRSPVMRRHAETEARGTVPEAVIADAQSIGVVAGEDGRVYYLRVVLVGNELGQSEFIPTLGQAKAGFEAAVLIASGKPFKRGEHRLLFWSR